MYVRQMDRCPTTDAPLAGMPWEGNMGSRAWSGLRANIELLEQSVAADRAAGIGIANTTTTLLRRAEVEYAPDAAGIPVSGFRNQPGAA